jgi:hypothetical protein
MYNQFLESIMANSATVEILDLNGNSVGDPKTSGPLTALEKSNKGVEHYRYPNALGSPSTGKNNKKHRVLFTIRDVDPAAFGNSQTNAAGIAGASAPTTIGGISGGAVGVAAVGAGLLSGVSNFNVVAGVQTAVSTSASGSAANYIFGGNGLTVSPPISNIKATISLYMPDTLTASYSANYEEMSLTSDLGPLLTTLRAIGSSTSENLVSTLKGMGNNQSTDPNIINAITGVLQQSGTDLSGLNVENIGTILQRASGYALNPQLQMVYRGTGLRSFDLEFTFTPKSKEEAIQVNSIIDKFRYYASPTLSSGKAGSITTNASTQGMYLIPPSIFNLQFFVNAQPSKYLPKYGDCILENVSVNHAPNGFSVFEIDGTMVQTQLSLSFKEMDILTRDKIDSGDRQ